MDERDSNKSPENSEVILVSHSSNEFEQGASDYRVGKDKLGDRCFFNLTPEEILYFNGWLWAKSREKFLSGSI